MRYRGIISSPEPKARWAIAIAFRPSGVNFLQFHFLRNRWADINQLGGDHPWGLGPKVIFMWSMWRPGRGWSWGEGPQRKKGGKTLKIFFSGPQSSTDYICFCMYSRYLYVYTCTFMTNMVCSWQYQRWSPWASEGEEEGKKQIISLRHY